jgi:hypothetical protein
MSKIISLDAKKDSLVKSLDGKSDEEKEKVRAEISTLDALIKKKTEDVKKIMNGEEDRYAGMIMLKANASILDAIVPYTKNALAKHHYETEYDKLPVAHQKEIDSMIESIERGGIAKINLNKAWNVYKSLATDKEIKKVAKSIDSKLSGYMPASSEDNNLIKMLSLVLRSNEYFSKFDSDTMSMLTKALFEIGKYKKASMIKTFYDKYVNPESVPEDS